MSGEGMVAVVQSLRDAGLAVTLLDGSQNRFSLVPNQAQSRPQPPFQTIRLQRKNSAAETESSHKCDSSAQATDGRYASVYQTTHCNLSPTSPPVQVTEFPPQRAEICPGHGNFEVGGLGSGETGRCPIRPHPQGQFRGGLNWVDRGAVCSPRSSKYVDAFASSLRKYPSSPGSSEMVERLINYSHAKNLSRNLSKSTSPVRAPESDVSHHTYTERSPRRCHAGGCGDLRSRPRVDEYPTRDGRTRREDVDRRPFNRNYDVRFVREVGRAKDVERASDYNYQYGIPELKTLSPSYQRKFPENADNNSVHTETQAAVKMVSKEVATVPKSEPLKKNVAVPQESTTSIGHVEGAVSDLPNPSQMDKNLPKIISFKAVQTTSSSIELVNTQKQGEARRSKSEDDLRRKHFQEGIIELIGNMAVNSKAKDEQLKDKILKDMWVKLQRVLENVEKQNNREKTLVDVSKKIRKGPVLIPIRYEKESRKKVRKWAEIDVYRASLPPFRISNTDGLEDIVKDWVNCLPIKSHDFTGRPIDTLQICDSLVRKLLKLFTCHARFDSASLKLEILNSINLAPLEIIGKRKRRGIDSSVDALVFKLRDVAPHLFKSEISSNGLSRNKYEKYNKHLNSIENNITKCVSNKVVDFVDKYDFKLNEIDENEIITELTEMLLDFIYEDGIANESMFKKDAISFLKDYNIDIDQGMELANALLKCIGQTTSPPTKCGIRNFIVCLNTSAKRQRRFSNASVNTDAYRDSLCHQIDEWLTNLPIESDKINDKNTRQAIINDLATEIVHRKKYLEFNSSETTEEKELEYLKYQIYKWIDKVIEDENMDIMEHASDLMDRIRDVPVPKLPLFSQNIFNVEIKNTAKSEEPNTVNGNVNIKDNNEVNNSKRRPSILKNQNVNVAKLSMPCCGGLKAQPYITVDQLNNDYDEYVKNWIKQIPISCASPEERELAEKLRAGIYNGVWKALTKLKFDPGTFHNSFYYQDMLDNVIEELFNCLPKSAELDAKKHILKSQLLEKTTNTHESIKKLSEPRSFKQALVEKVSISIPKTANEDQDDQIKQFEDLQILEMVEDFIVISNYEEDNEVVANTFKKKLIKKAVAFVQELKKLHGKELKDIDMNTYIQDIIDALSSVPIPSQNSLKEEAEEIMLGIEIEHWFNDLPLVQNDNYGEPLQRRRLRDKLTKKIANVQKSSKEECASESDIKNEITRFLDQVPLQPGEQANKSFMVEELLNRIRNKCRERCHTRRRSVVFHEDIKYPSYHAFSKELPHYSSISGNQSIQSNISSFQPNSPDEGGFYQTYNQNLNDSTFIGGGVSSNVVPTNASIYGGRGYTSFKEYRPLSSSMHPSHVEPDMNENVSLSQLLKSKWSTFEGTNPSQTPYNVPLTSNAQVAGPDSTWYSLEEVEIPPEMRSQFQQAPNLQSLKSMTYVDSQDQSNRLAQPPQSLCCVENKDTSHIAQIIEDQISRINQVATGHTVDASQIRDFSQVSNVSQNLGASRLNNEVLDQTNAGINKALQSNEIYNQNMNGFNEVLPMIQTNRLLNQSYTPRNNIDITQTARGNRSMGGTPSQMPSFQSKQNIANRSVEVSRTPQSAQYIPQQAPLENVQRSPTPVMQYTPQQIPLQNVSNMGPEIIETQQNMSIHSETPIPRATLPPQPIPSPQQYLTPQVILRPQQSLSPDQITGRNPEISEPNQISQQIQTQPSGSSYGQPQGFSTPQQEPNQRSPPRIGRKIHDPLRFRSGPARRRLDLDDDDEEGSEEDCPCITRLRRMYNEGVDYPCFYPFGFPYPYFF